MKRFHWQIFKFLSEDFRPQLFHIFGYFPRSHFGKCLINRTGWPFGATCFIATWSWNGLGWGWVWFFASVNWTLIVGHFYFTLFALNYLAFHKLAEQSWCRFDFISLGLAKKTGYYSIVINFRVFLWNNRHKRNVYKKFPLASPEGLCISGSKTEIFCFL